MTRRGTGNGGAHITPFAFTPPMTAAEYQAELARLDAERAAITEHYITSQTFPCWAYHATEPAQIVASYEAAVALGPGWSATPVPPPLPTVTALTPATVAIGAPSFTLHVHGTDFAPGAVIVFAGHDEPTTIVSPTEVTTGVDMSVWHGPDAVPVAVRVGAVVSNALDFTFTEAPGAARARSRS